MNKSDFRVVFMGTPQFAAESLKRILSEGFNVVGVVTAPDKPAGRGLKLSESDVKKVAMDNGLKIFQPLSLKDQEFMKDLKSLNPHLFIVVAFRMLPKAVWSLPPFGTFNLHASLLPHFRGAAPINWAIIKGVEKTGVTTFMIDEQIDTGSIIYSRECSIDPTDNFGSLHDKLMDIGANLVVKTTEDIMEERVTLTLQSSLEAQLGDVFAAPKLTRDNTSINWAESAQYISNLVRGLSPYPAAWSNFCQKSGETKLQVKIFEASFDNKIIEGTPGEIISDGKNYIRVITGKGIIDLITFQVAGKRKMSAKEFLMGFRNISDFKFEQ